ncbi:MAG: YfjI family protein [Prevotella sp.]|nr:YfjI family protein [Prevotella sp.]
MEAPFAIATDYGEAGRWAFHAICKLSNKYNETNANKMYSGAIASNHGVKHIASAFYLAKQAGVNIDEVRLKRAEERRKQREKNSKIQYFTGDTFPQVGARVHYNNRENAPYGATNTRNANIDYDDEAFENMPDDGEEPVSNNSEPYKPLPFLFDDYQWPKPLDEILTYAETKHQRDALFLGMVDAIGSTLSPYVRTMYGNRWMYPNLQVFVVAPPASGKGVVSWCRNFVEPQHERIRSAYRKEMEAYEKEKRIQEQMGRAKAEVEAPKLPANKMFLISGDNSSTGIAQNLIESDGRGIIIETEADTLSTALGTDYGRWSHMLRNFFDHSRISYNRRLNREYMEISRTMVSVLLAGTPAQVAPLIPSSENGLFSRELFYYMPAIREWRSQFRASSIDITSAMVSYGRKWLETCDEISKLGSVSLVLTPQQQSLFDNCFGDLMARCIKANENTMTASLARLAVNIIRIMSVIAVLRRIEHMGYRSTPLPISLQRTKETILYHLAR